MKWKSGIEPEPKLYDVRMRKFFAWTPVMCDDGYTRWLTWVWAREVYEGNPFDAELQHWRITAYSGSYEAS